MNKWLWVFICLIGLSASSQAVFYSINSNTNDTYIGCNASGLPTNVISYASAVTFAVGDDNFASSRDNGVAIVMFQLPTLTAELITNATLRVYWQTGYPGGTDPFPKNCEVYGIRYGTNSAAQTSDYAFKAIGVKGTLIQSNLFVLTNSVAAHVGTNVTDAVGSANLATWISDQYTAGAKGGDFIFLRIALDKNIANPLYMASANSTTSPVPRLTLDTLDISSGPCELVFTNTKPAQFVQKPFVTTNLSFVVYNKGYNATNVTIQLVANYPWLTLNGATSNFISSISGAKPTGPAATVTNLFNVTITSNALVGVYSNAFTLNMRGTGLDGSVSNFSSPISLQVLNTVFSSMEKKSFAAPTNGTDTSTVTISNQSGWALSYTLSSSQSWLLYPTGTLSLAANSTTNITVMADATLTPGRGQYTDTLAVSYLNNTSIPNPTNFPIVFDVGPKIEPAFAPQSSSVVITSVGGTNRIAGYEPGEQLDITVFSTNNGAITVSNIAHTLSANGYFTITASNPANYGVMNVGAKTSTTYRVLIANNTPEATYTLYATNSIVGSFWNNSISLSIINHAIPAVNPGSLILPAVAGGVGTGSVTVTNSGNASVNFTVGISGSWDVEFAVNTNAARSNWETGGTVLPLHDPNTNNPYIGAGDSGESDTIPIGFAFPLFGVNYTNLYVDANGAIILSSAVLTGNTNTADKSVDGSLPHGPRPLIAPFCSSHLIVSNKPVRYVRKTDRLIIIHDQVELSAYPAHGTNLTFQTELFTNGQIQINYYNINGSQLDQVAVGVQGATPSQVVNAGFIPASGKAIRLVPSDNVWVSGGPTQSTVPAFGSVTVTFTNNATDQISGETNIVTATFNWSGGGADNTSSNVAITATVGTATPVYSAVASLSFTGAAGQVESVPFIITNAGTGPLNFTINNTNSAVAGYISTNPAFSWIDISASGTPIGLIDPSPNPYITAADEGFSGMIPFGFIFPFYGSSYTQFCVSVNGAIRLDVSGRIISEWGMASANSQMPVQLIAPFWTDLAMDGNATLKYRATPTEIVITWENIRQYGLNGGSNQTFQAVLKPDGEILFQYQRLEGARWANAVTGLRDTTNRTLTADIRRPGDAIMQTNAYGWVSTQYVGVVSNRTVQLQTAQIQVIRYTPASGSIPAGAAAEIAIIGDASNQSAGSNLLSTNATLTIAHNTPGTNVLSVTFTVTNSLETGFVRALADDSDSDGLTDDAERIAGTDPQDTGSVFTVSTTSGRELSWTAAAGRTYTVWYTLNLADEFVKLDGAVGLTANSFTDTAHADDAVIYYKVTVD